MLFSSSSFFLVKITRRSGGPYWLLSLQKNEDGLSMSVVGFIIVQQEMAVDFVFMPTSLFAFTSPLSG